MKTSDAKRILIVKMSSLGDIIQSFDVLSYLYRKFPNVSIDWVVEERFASIVEAHPQIHRIISVDIKKIKHHWMERKNWKALLGAIHTMRQERYDLLFDLQGNCKSGVITFLCRAKHKIGFGKKSVREWPNILATHHRFEIPRSINIRQQYVNLVQRFFSDDSSLGTQGVRFKINENDQKWLNRLIENPILQNKCRVMVCPGTKWINKQLPQKNLELFLTKIEHALQNSFIFIWGTDEEKKICLDLHRRFLHCSLVIDRLELPLWQNLMNEMDLVIAVDSSALHLCATTSTPSFSIFGPTLADVFKPLGQNHLAFQGVCPYQRSFEKQCPLLRNCPSGACIREIAPDQLFDHFWRWWDNRFVLKKVSMD